MSGPIIRTGATPKFWNNWDNVFGKKTKGAAKKEQQPAEQKKEEKPAAKKKAVTAQASAKKATAAKSPAQKSKKA